MKKSLIISALLLYLSPTLTMQIPPSLSHFLTTNPRIEDLKWLINNTEVKQPLENSIFASYTLFCITAGFITPVMVTSLFKSEDTFLKIGSAAWTMSLLGSGLYSLRKEQQKRKSLAQKHGQMKSNSNDRRDLVNLLISNTTYLQFNHHSITPPTSENSEYINQLYRLYVTHSEQ